jgi:hypothetical protein
MASKYYKVYNCFPSFVPTFTQNGVSRANPLPNYGSVGDHLQDYFDNRMGETPAGGVGNLVAFLASEKSLTGIVQQSLTGMANSLSVTYGITAATEGYALLDLRGDSWKYLVGDGIIGPSNATNSTTFTSVRTAAISILNHFNKQYPNIKWAYAGLPNIPQFTTYAPVTGSSLSWSPSLTSNGANNNFWDAAHPTGSTATTVLEEKFYDWEHTPDNLKNFYRNQSITRVQSILDASGWACPDINPTISNITPFGAYMYSVKSINTHTSEVVSAAADYASQQYRVFPVMPLVSSTYKSHAANAFDSATGHFTVSDYVPGASGEVAPIFTGFTGGTAYAEDSTMPISAIRAGMLEPAAFAGADGFVYQDQMPMMVDLACTGATQTDARLAQAVSRARNFVASMVYGTYNTTSIPWTTVASEVKSYLSYNFTAYQLKAFSESIPVGDFEWVSNYLAGDTKSTTGASQGITGYDSSAWSQPSPQTPPASFTTGAGGGGGQNCCPAPDTGACCKFGHCTEGVKESDCGAAGDGNTIWVGGADCASVASRAECDPTLVNCCIPNQGCTQLTALECAQAGGSKVGNCSECCEGSSALAECICIQTCIGPVPGCPGTRTCIFYSLKAGACCCKKDGNLRRPSNCPSICGAACKSTPAKCCEGFKCGTYKAMSGDLLACCGTSCPDNTPSSGLGLCVNNGCPVQCSDSCNLTNFLGNTNIPNDVKSEVVHDMTDIFGIDMLSVAAAAPYIQNTSFRQTASVANSLSYYQSRGGDPTATYLNMIANYTPTATVASRIQEEFAFDRFFLPIAYT